MAATKKKAASPSSSARLDKIEAELAEVRRDVAQLRDDIARGLDFGANELRPLFGQGTLALVFDAIAKGLRKGVKDGNSDGTS